MATQFLSQSGVEIPKNLDKYVSIGQLKYYFAVDTSYVAKKIGVLLFPFTRGDWAIKYNQDEPVQHKYVGIIAVLISGLLLNTKGYYIGWIYVSIAYMFFLLRTLKLRIEPEVHGMQVHGKRKLYIILLYAILQPILIWFMTYSLVPISSTIEMPKIPENVQPFEEP